MQRAAARGAAPQTNWRVASRTNRRETDSGSAWRW
jgi:hypothetical protein